ncbi:MAG: glycosyltransferase family 2 protein [Nanoarchaeota archaeon]|nr:glycosyltransferase family 2 protein [Nanoarchaeota archaeon]
MKNKLFFAVPVYNEEKNLRSCIESLSKDTSSLNYSLKTFICLNGCTDNSERIALSLQKEYPKLNIIVLKSKKGKLNAQERIVKNINSKKDYVIFLDSDIEIKKGCIKKLISELNKYKKIMIVGAFPIARSYKGKNLWKKLISQILNIRSKHPAWERSKYDVSEYHPYALSDPQYKNTNKAHEAQSKIFFHGRMFALRSKNIWEKPSNKSGVVGDDTFLSDNTLDKYGKSSIRNRYDAIVYYEPFTSLLFHCRVYKRVYYDLKNLEKYYPKFKKIRQDSKLEINKDYLDKQSKKTKIIFYIYLVIRKIEKFLFKYSLEKDPERIWQYKNK